MVTRLDARLDFVKKVNTTGPPAVRAQVSVPYTNQGEELQERKLVCGGLERVTAHCTQRGTVRDEHVHVRRNHLPLLQTRFTSARARGECVCGGACVCRACRAW